MNYILQDTSDIETVDLIGSDNVAGGRGRSENSETSDVTSSDKENRVEPDWDALAAAAFQCGCEVVNLASGPDRSNDLYCKAISSTCAQAIDDSFELWII